MVDVLLRSGGDETVTNDDGLTAAGTAGDWVGEEDRVAGDFERLLKLLRDAPVDRTRRRRLVRSVPCLPPDRAQLTLKASQTRPGKASRTRGGVELLVAVLSWRGQQRRVVVGLGGIRH